MRLKIMAALRPLPPREQLEFMRLKVIVDTTDGNLGGHIVTLEETGYVEVDKDFLGMKPRTRVRLTKSGRRALENYVAFLRDIVGKDE